MQVESLNTGTESINQLDTVVTKSFVTGSTIEEYEIEPKEQKMGDVTIYVKKTDTAADSTVRFNISLIYRYF